MAKSVNGTGPLRVALVQMAMGSDPAANEAKAHRLAEKAVAKGAKVVCLPELYRTRYFPQTEDADNFELAEATDGSTAKAWSAFAKKHGVVLVVPYFEKRGPGLYHNSAWVFDADGRRAGHYRKMHIPDDPEFYEKFYFAPGDLGFPVFRTRYGVLSVLICWDQWFPEAARIAALQGAQILFFPTAIGVHDHVDAKTAAEHRDAWRTVQRGHAIANGLFVAAPNRVGTEGKLRFWGRSFVAGPFGRVVAEAGEGEEVLVADLDLAAVERVRRGWPFLRDRRIDAYGPLGARFLDERATH